MNLNHLNHNVVLFLQAVLWLRLRKRGIKVSSWKKEIQIHPGKFSFYTLHSQGRISLHVEFHVPREISSEICTCR